MADKKICVWWDGDSHCYGETLSYLENMWLQQFTNIPGFQVDAHPIGLSGEYIQLIDERWQMGIDAAYQHSFESGYGAHWLIIIGGGNDLAGGETGADTFAHIASIVTQAITKGFSRIFVFTGWNTDAFDPPAKQAEHVILNNLILENADIYGYEVVDANNFPFFSDYTDRKYFIDNAHLQPWGSTLGIQRFNKQSGLPGLILGGPRSLGGNETVLGRSGVLPPDICYAYGFKSQLSFIADYFYIYLNSAVDFKLAIYRGTDDTLTDLLFYSGEINGLSGINYIALPTPISVGENERIWFEINQKNTIGGGQATYYAITDDENDPTYLNVGFESILYNDWTPQNPHSGSIGIPFSGAVLMAGLIQKENLPKPAGNNILRYGNKNLLLFKKG